MLRGLHPCVLSSLVLLAACGGPSAEGPAVVMPSAPPPPAPAPLPAVAPVAAVGDVPAPAPAPSYDKPPQNVLDVLHAPSPPQPSMSPIHDTILLVTWTDYPSMARVAEPFLKLAGVRVEPRNRSRHDTPGGYGITACATDFVLTKVADASEIHVALPQGVCAGSPLWTADGRRYAFRNLAADAVELWIGEATSAEVHRVAGVRLNQMLGSSMQWMPDGKTMLVKLVPEGLGPPPPAPVVPVGPSVQESTGEKGQSSTYEARDTLRDKHDEDLFDYYVASQLALVDTVAGHLTPIGKVSAFDDVSRSPDGQHILVETIHKPYSYVTAYDRFPRDVAVWDGAGNVEHPVASIPLADRVPIHGVRTGPRDFDWRATEPATLVWAEALDGGDWNAKVPARDKILMQKAPFLAPPVEIARTEQRFGGFTWAERPELALLTEYDDNRQWTKTFTLDVDDPKTKPHLLWDMSSREHYKHPGSPVMRALPDGEWVIQQVGDAIYLSGQGSSPEGDRPFLDRLDLKTGKTERLFRSDKTAYEWFFALLDPAARTFVTWHQSPSDAPNALRHTLGASVASPAAGEPAYASTTQAITHIPDPTPAVRAIKKRLVKYKRKDGVDLSFTLYTPPGYQEGTRVPTILYAYPLDYADASKAGQVTGSEQTFTRLRDYKLLLLAGYAILDNAGFPIVGDPKKAYDTYLEQLVADAKAAVDKAIAIGVADPDRIGVTGHSHGALMTANLMAHSDLFRAGAATSGSYNKTLTPFGFQNERRSVWQAQHVYLEASPFFFADKMKGPLLIMHGADDANPGTTPLQAEKLYEAIRGNGGVARLVMLPHEPHWYSAMESNEQLLYEEIRWFDRYVKEAAPRTRAKAQERTR
jgi:dipeptidyl aminopeptidase/acylaminoacyl peptidase